MDVAFLNLHSCDRQLIQQILTDARKNHPDWSEGEEIQRHLYSQLLNMNREDLLILLLKTGIGKLHSEK